MSQTEKILVCFRNVGRGRSCWTVELPDLQIATLLRALKAKKVLASRALSIEWEDTTGAAIYAGDRYVGRIYLPTHNRDGKPLPKWTEVSR